MELEEEWGREGRELAFLTETSVNRGPDRSIIAVYEIQQWEH